MTFLHRQGLMWNCLHIATVSLAATTSRASLCSGCFSAIRARHRSAPTKSFACANSRAFRTSTPTGAGTPLTFAVNVCWTDGATGFGGCRVCGVNLAAPVVVAPPAAASASVLAETLPPPAASGSLVPAARPCKLLPAMGPGAALSATVHSGVASPNAAATRPPPAATSASPVSSGESAGPGALRCARASPPPAASAPPGTPPPRARSGPPALSGPPVRSGPPRCSGPLARSASAAAALGRGTAGTGAASLQPVVSGSPSASRDRLMAKLSWSSSCRSYTERSGRAVGDAGEGGSAAADCSGAFADAPEAEHPIRSAGALPAGAPT